MIFQNILVPYDGSKHAIRAFKVALDMARKYNSKIKVVTCAFFRHCNMRGL